jgi:hypothetical protein
VLFSVHLNYLESLRRHWLTMPLPIAVFTMKFWLSHSES